MPQVGEVVEVNGGRYETSGTVGVVISTVSSNALVQAAMNDDLEDVKARVLMRAKVNVRDKAYDGISPLHAAVENGNIAMVQFLLDRGAKNKYSRFQETHSFNDDGRRRNAGVAPTDASLWRQTGCRR